MAGPRGPVPPLTPRRQERGGEGETEPEGSEGRATEGGGE